MRERAGKDGTDASIYDRDGFDKKFRVRIDHGWIGCVAREMAEYGGVWFNFMDYCSNFDQKFRVANEV